MPMLLRQTTSTARLVQPSPVARVFGTSSRNVRRESRHRSHQPIPHALRRPLFPATCHLRGLPPRLSTYALITWVASRAASLPCSPPSNRTHTTMSGLRRGVKPTNHPFWVRASLFLHVLARNCQRNDLRRSCLSRRYRFQECARRRRALRQQHPRHRVGDDVPSVRINRDVFHFRVRSWASTIPRRQASRADHVRYHHVAVHRDRRRSRASAAPA